MMDPGLRNLMTVGVALIPVIVGLVLLADKYGAAEALHGVDFKAVFEQVREREERRGGGQGKREGEGGGGTRERGEGGGIQGRVQAGR